MRTYLFLRKLESSKISKEAPQVMAGSEAPEGMILREMLEQPWQKPHIYHIHMPHACFKLSPKNNSLFFLLHFPSLGSSFHQLTLTETLLAEKLGKVISSLSNLLTQRGFQNVGMKLCQIKYLDTSYDHIVCFFFPPLTGNLDGFLFITQPKYRFENKQYTF